MGVDKSVQEIFNEAYDQTNKALTVIEQVPSADATANTSMAQVVGAKDDTANETAGTTSSLMRYLKGVLAILGTRATAAATGAVGATTTLVAYVKQLVTAILAIQNKTGVTGYDQATDSLEAQSDKLGAFSGDGGAAQDDSAKASLDLAHTDLDTIITATDTVEAELAKVPKSDAAVTWNATALASVNAEVDTALNTIVPAAPTVGSVNDILSKASGGNTFDKTTDSLEALRDRMDAIETADQADLDAILADTGTDGVKINSETAAYQKVEGKTQVFEAGITSAANAGLVSICTATDNSVIVKSVCIHALAAQTADMTSCAVKGGTGQAITFITAAVAVQAALDATDKQVNGTGYWRLGTGKTIVIDLQGTGATAVNLVVSVEYFASNGSAGYLA